MYHVERYQGDGMLDLDSIDIISADGDAEDEEELDGDAIEALETDPTELEVTILSVQCAYPSAVDALALVDDLSALIYKFKL